MKQLIELDMVLLSSSNTTNLTLPDKRDRKIESRADTDIAFLNVEFWSSK